MNDTIFAPFVGAKTAFKREPFDTQLEALNDIAKRDRYILLGEPGSGKSLVLINDIQRRFVQGEIDTVVIAVPALNLNDWKNDHLPKDMNVDYRLFVYKTFTTKKIKAEYETFKLYKGLRILLISNEMLSGEYHQRFIEAFLCKYRTMLVIDEVHDYASPVSKRTTFVTDMLYHAVDKDCNFLDQYVDAKGKRRWKGTAFSIRHRAKVIGIATGTLFTQSPMSLWASSKLMNFNAETINSFKTRFMITTMDKTPQGKVFFRSLTPREIAMVRDNLKTNGAEEVAALTGISLSNVQAIAETKMTLPYKNLKGLKAQLDVDAVRMPLPESARLPIVDVELHVAMTKEQKELTSRIATESLAFIKDKGVAVSNAMNIHLRLAQISSGFMPVNVIQETAEGSDDATFDEYPDFDRLTSVRNMEPITINERSPKLTKLVELLSELDMTKPALVSCLFRAELKAITDAISEDLPFLRVGVIQGGIGPEERSAILAKFNAKEIDVVVMNERAGRGLNLQLADKLIIVSSSASADRRKQLIARIRRTGQLEKFVRVWHILCEKSIDVKIESVLVQLARVADYVNNGTPMEEDVVAIENVVKDYLEGKEEDE